MVDDRPEDIGPAPDPGRAKREPPTIDLEATEVSDDTGNAAAAAGTGAAIVAAARRRAFHRLIAAASGAGAAALVLGAAWFAGWPAATPPHRPRSVPSVPLRSMISPRVSPASSSRSARRQSRARSRGRRARGSPGKVAGRAARRTRHPARASGEAGRDDQRREIGAARAAPPPDLSAINERIAQIERAVRTQSAEIAKESSKPADDVPLRRIVAAALLDVLVRTGDPYPAALAAAKTLAPAPDALKPLEGFAASGVPSAASLNRELLTLVPKLSPPAPDNPTTGSGIVDRLQAGAAKLVRIERTDTVGSDRGAVVSRVTAAALRNDFRRGAAGIEDAGAGRSRRRASLARQGRRPGCCARGRPSIRRRCDGSLAKPAP